VVTVPRLAARMGEARLAPTGWWPTVSLARSRRSNLPERLDRAW